MPLKISIKQKAIFVVLAILFSHLFIILLSFIPEWQAGAILIFTIMITTYLFVKYFSSKRSKKTTEVYLLTEPIIDGENFQEGSTNVSLVKDNPSQVNIHEIEEVVSEPEQVEVIPKPGLASAPKRLNRDLMDTLVQQLHWYKKQLSIDQYEQLIVDHAKEQLHDYDYYLFTSILRDHFIKTKPWDKLKGLLSRLKQRYHSKVIILEEISFFEEKFFQS